MIPNELFNSMKDMVSSISRSDESVEIVLDNLIQAAAIYAAANDIGVHTIDDTKDDEWSRTIRGEYVDLHVLATVIAYRLSIGDLKLVDVSDIGKKRDYYNKLIVEIDKQ